VKGFALTIPATSFLDTRPNLEKKNSPEKLTT